MPGLVFGIDDSLIEEITTLGRSLTLSTQSRKFEIEADQVSLEILQQPRRDLESMVKFFDKVATECGEGCKKPNCFDSHPRLDHRRALFEKTSFTKHSRPAFANWQMIERQSPLSHRRCAKMATPAMSKYNSLSNKWQKTN